MIRPALSDSGFTLIEILVVVVILAVMAATVTLAVGGVGGERQLSRETEQAQALIGHACEQAELTGKTIGISLNSSGYRFSELHGDDWLPLPLGEFRERAWLEGTASALSRDGQPVQIGEAYPDKPQLVCFSSGELTPFRLTLALADLPIRYRLDGQPDGDMTTTAIDARVR